MKSRIPILTIAIPTFNRKDYLEPLLQELITQRHRCQYKDLIEFLVIDNNSEDDTARICNNFLPEIIFLRNAENIGGDANFLECIQKSSGKYVWLFGDDEVLNSNALNRVLTLLIHHNPGFVITESSYEESVLFDSYRNLLKTLLPRDPIFPVHHTLITRNIFPRSGFNEKIAKTYSHTNYGHMYGLIDHIAKCNGVFLYSYSDALIRIRKERAPFAETPNNLEKKLIAYARQLSTALGCPRVGTNVVIFYKYRFFYKIIYSKKLKKAGKFFQKLMAKNSIFTSKNKKNSTEPQ